jgi:hypothetical protein|tara:strand:- start:1605 stop:2534 length:930 start_codon:yes stop_codon:yes gene_type:complete
MEKSTKNFYLTNKDMLREIHNSKMSYCWTRDDNYLHYDLIVTGFEEVTQEAIDEAKQIRATRLQKQAHQVEVKRWEQGLTGKKTKPRAADFVVDVGTIQDDDIVLRVMTFEHVPEENRKNKPKTEADLHAKCNFPPFKHYAMIDSKWTEVAKSHWDGGKDNGHFSVTHGKTNDTLARMYLKLCQRYSMRGNWRGYTYVDEMRGQALLQLAQIGLQFNELKSQNPFAYYTAAINNSFTRVLNLEKRSQNIRDDLLEEEGLNPSSTRTFNAEWAAHIDRETKRKVDNPTIKVTEYEVPEADTDVEEIKTGE